MIGGGGCKKLLSHPPNTSALAPDPMWGTWVYPAGVPFASHTEYIFWRKFFVCLHPLSFSGGFCEPGTRSRAGAEGCMTEAKTWGPGKATHGSSSAMCRGRAE